MDGWKFVCNALPFPMAMLFRGEKIAATAGNRSPAPLMDAATAAAANTKAKADSFHAYREMDGWIEGRGARARKWAPSVPSGASLTVASHHSN